MKSSSKDPSTQHLQSLVEQAEALIRSDDKEEFTSLLRKELAAADDDNKDTIFITVQGVLLKLICYYRAVGCARALLELEVVDSDGKVIKVNVNEPLEGVGYSPLDLAALSLSDELTEIFLDHGMTRLVGANEGEGEGEDHVMVPLSLALDAFCEHNYVHDWAPGKSFFKLFCILCISELKEGLDTIKLLASKTNHVEKVGFHCVEKGKIVQLAALLLVAWDKFVTKGSEVEGSPIEQHINSQPRLGNTWLHYLHQRMLDMLSELATTRRDVIEEFRNSEEAICARRYELPDRLGEIFESQLDLRLWPSEKMADDIKCLARKLSPEEKALLEEALDKKIKSHSGSTTVGPISFFPYVPSEDECDRLDISGASPEDEIELALMLDNRDYFVKVMNRVKSDDSLKPLEFVTASAKEWMIVYDSVNCATAVFEGEIDGAFDFESAFKSGLNPLHPCARDISPRLTKLFLEKGFDANVRRDCKIFNLKEALPLNVALTTICSKVHGIFLWPRTNSVVDLVTELCGDTFRDSLENVRLLVPKTHDVKDEFLRYAKEGKMVELCSLLIVAHKEFDSFINQPNSIMEFPDSSSICVPHSARGRMGCSTAAWPRPLGKPVSYQLDKQIRLLFHIFNKIGDQMGAYVQLDNTMTSSRTMRMQVAWLMEKAGLVVNGEVTEVNHDASRREVNSAVDIKHFDFYSQRHSQGLPIFGKLKQAPSNMRSNNGFPLSFHTSSLKAQLNLASVTPSRRLIKVVRYLHSSNLYTSTLELIRKGSRTLVLASPKEGTSWYDLVLDCRGSNLGCNLVALEWVHREGNIAADHAARQAKKEAFGSTRVMEDELEIANYMQPHNLDNDFC